MMQDTARLMNQLPRLARAIAQDVYEDLQDVTCSNETRSTLALAAGLREVVEGGEILDMLTLAREEKEKRSLVQLIGFADARCRKAIGAWLSKEPYHVEWLAKSCGVRGLATSRRINGLFRYAIAYAEEI